jgi:predicted AlkP superfamily pyrophosphatase or phosphodiesterase
VPNFFCLAELGWVIAPNAKGAERTIGGTHGYDNLAPEMEALFIASGPAFERQVVLSPFENVDVYPLMMNLLGLQALPSDGNLTPFAQALKGAKQARK